MPLDLIESLGPGGVNLVTRLWSEYGPWSPAQLVVLHEVGACVDLLAQYETSLPKARAKDLERLRRGQRQTRASLLQMFAALDLREA